MVWMEKSQVNNILVVGNGFDLHHYLPTRYKDFINVIKRLFELEEIGKIDFCNFLAYIYGTKSPLNQHGNYIGECYRVHKDEIDKIVLDYAVHAKIINSAKANVWMKYFLHREENTGGWIDFEKEIAQVLEAFSEAIDTLNEMCKKVDKLYKTYELDRRNTSFETLYILDKFPEIFENYNGTMILKAEFWNKAELEGTIENIKVNEEKIVDYLYMQLRELKKILVLYIQEFVQKIAVNKKSQCFLFENVDAVISFNYTNTYSLLYNDNIKVFYIHGNANRNNIVLGINDDESDQLDKMNLRFVKFKKYYQRIINNTFVDYKTLIGEGEACVLHFVGHSLDKTDRDIIKSLINSENVVKSIIYYHDKNSYSQLIINLVSLFGKNKFDELMQNHKIEFVELEKFEKV